MKKLTLIIAMVTVVCGLTSAQTGRSAFYYFYSQALDDTMQVNVYLPPGYNDNPDWYYPVIYYLHAWKSNTTEMNAMVTYLDSYITNGTIDPVIMVCPINNPPPFQGNMYVNSEIWGDYEYYNVYDLVEWVEMTFRAMPYREYRGLMGQSMGAHGSFRYGILYKDKFKALAAHAAIVTTDKDLWLDACQEQVILEHPQGPPYSYNYTTDGNFTKGTFLLSGAWSANLESTQSYVSPQIVDFLFDENADYIDSTLAMWHTFDIAHIIQQLTPDDGTGILFGCGSNDDYLLYPANLALKDTLEMLGLPYEFYDHSGSHAMPAGFRQRSLTFLDSQLLPPNFHTGPGETPGKYSHHVLNIYPNPFTVFTGIYFELRQAAHCRLTVMDHLGREVAVLFEGLMPRGQQHVEFGASGMTSGLYFCRLEAGNESITKKIIKF